MSNVKRDKRNGTFDVDKGNGTKEYYRKRELEDGYISDDGTIIEPRELGDGFIVRTKHGESETFQENILSDGYTGNRGSKIRSTGKNKYEYKSGNRSEDSSSSTSKERPADHTAYARNSVSYSDTSSGGSIFDTISNAIGSFLGGLLLIGIGLMIVGEIFNLLFKGAKKVLQVVWPILLLAAVIIAIIFVMKKRKKTAKGFHSSVDVSKSDLQDDRHLTTPRKAKSNNTPKKTRSAQTLPDNTCCICGQELRNGYAVLFTKTNGVEARIDETCHQAIETLAKSEDIETLESSIRYISRYIGKIDQDVENKVKEYINSAEDYINGTGY